RLGFVGATLTAIEVDTPAARSLAPEQRMVALEGQPYPVALCGRDDMSGLCAAIEASAGKLADPQYDHDPQARRPLALQVRFPAHTPLSNNWLRALLSQASATRLAELAAVEAGVPTEPEPMVVTYSRLARGQGFVHNHDQKRAVDQHAMKLARDFLTESGWRVRTMNTLTFGHNFVCMRDGLEMRVEVRGTTGAGDRVFATAGEIEQAARDPEASALLVVFGIKVRHIEGRWLPEGGTLRFIESWDPKHTGTLRPKDYIYMLPPWED
ncbi:MAG: hypothetical protein KC457_11930, partial [Myxococcales bacterium]|nr:hypothetical protein [Myxococcales bacterium]